MKTLLIFLVLISTQFVQASSHCEVSLRGAYPLWGEISKEEKADLTLEECTAFGSYLYEGYSGYASKAIVKYWYEKHDENFMRMVIREK